MRTLIYLFQMQFLSAAHWVECCGCLVSEWPVSIGDLITVVGTVQPKLYIYI